MAYFPPTDWELKDFYREHVDSLYRSCWFLTCGQADAQKMTEDIFLSLLKKGMIFSSDKDARAWMILKAYKMSRKPPKLIPAEQHDDQVHVTTEGEGIPAQEDAELEVQNKPAEHIPEDVEMETETVERDVAVESSAPVMDKENENPELCEAKTEIPVAQFPEELRNLSRRDRLIALMYYCESYRKAEIANYLGWPTFRVNNRLMHIKKRILSEKGVAEAC